MLAVTLEQALPSRPVRLWMSDAVREMRCEVLALRNPVGSEDRGNFGAMLPQDLLDFLLQFTILPPHAH